MKPTSEPDELFTFRLATADDAAIITHHRRAMFADMGHTDEVEILDQMATAFRDWVRRKLEQGIYIGFFMENAAGQVVAGAGCWIMEWPPHLLDPSAERAYILNVYTEPAYRGRGLAKHLMQSVLDFCETRHLSVITLHASQFGRPMYEQMGFTQTNEMRLVRRG